MLLEPTTSEELAMALAAIAVVGYLLGSIPFGLVLTRLAGLGDIRKTGSGNIGATNVLRTGSKPLAALTLVLDGGKGAAAVLVCLALFPSIPAFAAIAGAGAFLGHLYPVWLGFRGGKGVATFLGILLAINWQVGAASCFMWLVTAILMRISSLSALVAAAMSPVIAWFLAPPEVTLLAAAMAVAIFVRHKDNIRRLIRGEEPRIGKKA